MHKINNKPDLYDQLSVVNCPYCPQNRYIAITEYLFAHTKCIKIAETFDLTGSLIVTRVDH